LYDSYMKCGGFNGRDRNCVPALDTEFARYLASTDSHQRQRAAEQIQREILENYYFVPVFRHAAMQAFGPRIKAAKWQDVFHDHDRLRLSVGRHRAQGVTRPCETVSARSLLELGRLGISGPAAAAWLRTIAQAVARTPAPDLVWSGPEVPGLHARDTRRVYEELLGSAERSIWASTYAFFDGSKAFDVLARRMESRPRSASRCF